MENLKSLRPVIIIFTAFTILATGCAKDKSAYVNSAVKPGLTVKDLDPGNEKTGAVKGYVTPANVKAKISLTNATDGSCFSTFTDQTGLFFLEKIPAGRYILDAIPADADYESAQFKLLVIAGNTTVLNIALAKKTDNLYP